MRALPGRLAKVSRHADRLDAGQTESHRLAGSRRTLSRYDADLYLRPRADRSRTDSIGVATLPRGSRCAREGKALPRRRLQSRRLGMSPPAVKETPPPIDEKQVTVPAGTTIF